MLKKILSVYITSEEIRVCELMKNGANVSVRKAFNLHTPTGAIDDGQLMDVEEIAQVLLEGFSTNGIKKGKVSFVISSRKIANKEIVIPYMKNKGRVGEIIRTNIDDYFPMNNLEDYICRHTILDTFENAEGKHYSVAVIAIHKQMVESYYELAGLLKMPIETIDYYGNSIYQLLKKQLNQGTILGLQMDKDITYVSIMRGQAQLFRRSIPYGKDVIVHNLSVYKGISTAEAEEILKDPDKRDKMITEDEYSELIQDFSSAITRVVEFHTSRNPGILIELGKLMGTGVGMLGFSKVLSNELGIEIQDVKEINGIKIYKKNMDGLNYENIVEYLPNIGVCFRSLDLKKEDEKKSQSSNVVFYVLIGFFALVNAGIAVFLLVYMNDLKARKEQVEDEIIQIESAEAVYNAYAQAKNDYQVIEDYYESTRNDNEALYQLILDLEKIMPEGVGITNLAADAGSITLSGMSNGKSAVAKFVIELKKLNYISNVRVETMTETYDDLGGSTSVFKMEFQLNLPDDLKETDGDLEGAAADGGNE